MEQSGGEAAVKLAKGSGEDRLSALTDDVLVLILLGLCIKDATRTSVLSRRWRRVWTLLPELHFGVVQDPHLLRDFLSASDVPLRSLHVCYPDATPQSLAAWLPAAARRVSGELLFSNLVERRAIGDDDEEEDSQRCTFELPYMEKATSIYLDLGFLGLSVPPAGVFARLTDLDLGFVRFHSPGELEEALSSPRCPCLQKLAIRSTKGLDKITIDSQSLQLLEFRDLRGVRQITIVAPALEDFTLWHCFMIDKNQPVVNISAPQLKFLKWADAYDPSSVHLGTMEHLQKLGALFFVYGLQGFAPNHHCLMLLQRFKAIEYLVLSLCYLSEIYNLHYVMEDMTILPDVTSLKLVVLAEEHAIGACSFHVLRICSGIKRLTLVLSSQLNLKEQTVCSSGCICRGQPTNWKTEELSLNCLQELEIEGFGASEHEVAFVKRLLNWVTVLKTLTVTFRHSINKSKAKEFFHMCQSFSRSGVCMNFYIYQNCVKLPYAPED